MCADVIDKTAPFDIPGAIARLAPNTDDEGFCISFHSESLKLKDDGCACHHLNKTSSFGCLLDVL